MILSNRLVCGLLAAYLCACAGASQKPEPETESENAEVVEAVERHLPLISEAIDEGVLDEYAGPWTHNFDPEVIVCIDNQCQRDADDYASLAWECAKHGSLGLIGANADVMKHLTGPLLGKFLRQKMILITVGYQPNIAVALATAAVAGGCAYGFSKEWNEGKKQISECQTKLDNLKRLEEQDAKLQKVYQSVEEIRAQQAEILKQIMKLQSFIEALDKKK